MLESYLEIIVVSFVNLYHIRWVESGEKFAAVMAVANNVAFVLFPLFAYILLKRHEFKLDDPSFKQKFGDLYIGFKSNNFKAILYNFYFLLRRMILAMAFVILEDYVFFQLIVLTIGSYAIILYTIRVNPYEI